MKSPQARAVVGAIVLVLFIPRPGECRRRYHFSATKRPAPWSLESITFHSARGSSSDRVTLGRVALQSDERVVAKDGKVVTLEKDVDDLNGKEDSQWQREVPTNGEKEETAVLDDEADDGGEIAPAVLSGITSPLIPNAVWHSLNGHEFYSPRTIQSLCETGIKTALGNTEESIDWRPDKKTSKIVDSKEEKAAMEGGEVLVYVGKFKGSGRGSDLPLIRTHSILPLSPRDFAELLMDSSRVKLYNKMSLGRTDEMIFQSGIDTQNGAFGDGEAKIVRNRTKPPMMKKVIEFVTLMHARRLRGDDEVGVGILGDSENGEALRGGGGKGPGEGGYVVVSRAVQGGRWGGSSDSATTNGESKEDGTPSTRSGRDDNISRSEILLGVNLIRDIPGQPNAAEVTAVTHVYSPTVPTLLAGKVGLKGAVDFVRDIRALCT